MIKWLILIGLIVIICVAEWMREIFTFKITHYQITSDKLTGLKNKKNIVFLTDLHNNSYGRHNERLLNAVREQEPDCIFIGGDMLVGKSGASTKVAEELMGELTKICPVYYANGNHEQRMKLNQEKYGTIFQEYKVMLAEKGVRFLENERETFIWDDCSVHLYGLEIPEEHYKKFLRMELPVEEVEKRIGKAERCFYNILLAHNPTYAETYLKWDADLVLCGHFHGGVVRIPGLGGIITPQWHVFPKYSGELTVKDGKSVVVSKGLGTHTIKLRFLNPAELVVLHIGLED